MGAHRATANARKRRLRHRKNILTREQASAKQASSGGRAKAQG